MKKVKFLIFIFGTMMFLEACRLRIPLPFPQDFLN